MRRIAVGMVAAFAAATAGAQDAGRGQALCR